VRRISHDRDSLQAHLLRWPMCRRISPTVMRDLDANTKIPASLLPAYVDDVLEYSTRADFPVTGISGVIYVAVIPIKHIAGADQLM
jgi:hypothetical protein